MFIASPRTESELSGKEARNLLIFCSDLPFACDLENSLRSVPNLRVLDTLDNTGGLDAYLRRREVDFLLLFHERETEIISTVKPLYPAVKILLLDRDSPYADCRLDSRFSLASQIENFTRQSPTHALGGTAFYHRLSARIRVTDRELEILYYLSFGHSYERVAALLRVEVCTVQKHVNTLRKKVNALDKAHLLCIALRSGLIR